MWNVIDWSILGDYSPFDTFESIFRADNVRSLFAEVREDEVEAFLEKSPGPALFLVGVVIVALLPSLGDASPQQVRQMIESLTDRALAMGFKADDDFESIVRDHLEVIPMQPVPERSSRG